MSERKLWHIFSGLYYPMSLEQEKVFIKSLRDVYKPAKFDRDDLSVLLSVLRCNAKLENVLEVAPGIDPGALLASYDYIEEKRVKSILAWMSIEKKPTTDIFDLNKEEASKLLPVVIGNLMNSENVSNPQYLKSQIKEIAHSINDMRIVATGKEATLYKFNLDRETKINVGVELYNPSFPGVYGNSFYLPDRVSSISPIRVRDLLAESLIDENI